MKGFEGDGHKVVIKPRYDPSVERHNLLRGQDEGDDGTVYSAVFIYMGNIRSTRGADYPKREHLAHLAQRGKGRQSVSGGHHPSIPIHPNPSIREPTINSGRGPSASRGTSIS
jgi:hypothetical protein